MGSFIFLAKHPLSCKTAGQLRHLSRKNQLSGCFVMEYIMTNNSGIYKITNTVTGDFYIGSSVNLYNRIKKHRYSLIGNYHTNSHLQNSWNKHGTDCFEFSILEYCDKELLLEREQSYINTQKPSYNICPIAGNSLGFKHSEESKQKISQAQKGRPSNTLGKHFSEEAKQNISIAHMGHVHTEEHKQHISEANKGRVVTKETRKKISGEQNHMFGKHLSDETKLKISEAQNGERNHNFGKKMSEEQKRKISEALCRRHAKIRAQTKSMPEIESAYHGICY